jgi:carboxyl-terminal processing protease
MSRLSFIKKVIKVCKYGIVLHFTGLSGAAFAWEGDVTNFHYSMLFLAKDTLPFMHFSQEKIDDKKSKAIYDEIISAVDKDKLYLTLEFVNKHKSEVGVIDDKIDSLDLLWLFDFVDLINNEKSQSIDMYFKMVSGLTEDLFVKSEALYKNNNLYENYPLNKSHQLVIMKRKALLEIGHNLSRGDSFANAKLKVLNEIKDTQSIIMSHQNSDDYLYLLLNSIYRAYDPHSRFINHNDSNRLNYASNNKDYRIGLDFEFKDGFPHITNVVSGSVAEKAGIFSKGDSVLKVGVGDKLLDLSGISVPYMIDLISSYTRDGGPVEFYIKKSNGIEANAELIIGQVDGKKDLISLENYHSLLNDSSVNVIKVSSFYTNVSQEVKALIKGYEEEDLIVDLRNNTGGSMYEAINLASLFMDGGVVLKVKDKDGIHTFYDEDENFYRGRVVLLVNNHTASASEIMASALQYHKNALILGTTTYGKGTVQKFVDLKSDEYKLPFSKNKLGGFLVTIAVYYSADGNSVQAKGVIPDVQLVSYDHKFRGESSLRNVIEVEPIESDNQASSKNTSWYNEFERGVNSAISSEPLYKYYISKLKQYLEDKRGNYIELEEWMLEDGIDKESKLLFVNLNRRYQGLGSINSLNDIEDGYKIIDVPLEITSLLLNKSKINTTSRHSLPLKIYDEKD